MLDIESKLLEERQRLAELLNDEEVNVENLLFYKNDIVQASSADSRIYEIDLKIGELKQKINERNKEVTQRTQTRQNVEQSLILNMNQFYAFAEPEDPLTIDDLFTKSTVNYSGSQGALFLMARLFAISKIMSIDFPIIIDHFRGGELSSIKETKVIDLFSQLGKQVIFTCTLKNEEQNKYDNKNNLTSISFNDVEKFQLLNEKYNERFNKLLLKFAIDLRLQ